MSVVKNHLVLSQHSNAPFSNCNTTVYFTSLYSIFCILPFDHCTETTRCQPSLVPCSGQNVHSGHGEPRRHASRTEPVSTRSAHSHVQCHTIYTVHDQYKPYSRQGILPTITDSIHNGDRQCWLLTLLALLVAAYWVGQKNIGSVTVAITLATANKL